MKTVRTSQSHPLYVTVIDDALPGRVSITMAPGKRCAGAYAGVQWERDVAADLDHLVENDHITMLVCLLEDDEMRRIGVPHLLDEARKRVRVLHVPIRDGGLPPDEGVVVDLVEAIHAAATAGENVVIHCRGGLGRAGTVAGCYLRRRGLSVNATFERLKKRHKTSCPENQGQRDFVARFPAGPVEPARTAVRRMDDKGRADRVAGAILGGAIGDAMGHPTEFLSMQRIVERFGPRGVTGFELWWTRDGHRFAPYTDDTQMAEIVLRSLLHGLGDDGDASLDAVMTHMGAGFASWAKDPQGGHRAPGNACLAGSRRLASGVSWREAGGATAGGCGSVMRAHPFGLVCDDLDTAEAWAVAHSRLTHQDPIALAACAACARGICLALQGAAPDDIAADMVAAAARYSRPTAAMMQLAVDDAGGGVPPSVTLDRLRGWAAHEAIAAALYVFLRHPDDPRAAILEGANTPGDSDSIASIAGALVGARCGLQALPLEWVRDVERSPSLLALSGTTASLGRRLTTVAE
jgi:ADP-ribosylglycohydrolase